ncbi:ABC transporter substrate-binding protein [Salibacterium aidingense]|uniref:ABC transporter substrate-binding protein n=1 Tax=Salibacterium aidingense TaxID=384933 RepID=UPI003BC29F88
MVWKNFFRSSAALALLLAGCSSGEDTPSNSDARESSGGNMDEPVEVTFWHSMTDKNGDAIETFVEDFNASQDEIDVEEVYQGSYDEAFTKLRTNLNSNSGPTLFQSNFIRSGPMVDTDMITPIQNFVDQGDYDLSSLDPNVLSAYEMEDQLFSMPFNASTLLMYYNKDMFEENGLEPDNPPRTYEEVTETAQTLTDDNQYGASFAMTSYFLEQLITVQGAELVNNGNGRDGLADESLIDSEEALNTYSWWADLVDNGYMLNVGTDGQDAQQAFLSGQSGMTLNSTAVLGQMIEGAKGNFEVGTTFIPYPEDKEGDGGVSVGGGSLYVMNNTSEEEQNAAWEFIKYLMKPEQQAYWYTETGYFPVNTDAFEEETVQDTLETYPQFETAIDQLELALKNDSGNNAGKGPVIGMYPEVRDIQTTTLEEIVNSDISPKEALEKAQTEITNELQNYNNTMEE